MLDEERDICLNCPKPECTNCLGTVRGFKNKYVPILQIDPATNKIVAIHDSIQEAVRATGLRYSSLHRAITKNKPWGGYLWRKSR